MSVDKKIILLVEDNPDDIELTLRALDKSRVLNEVVVTHDGAEALEYLFGDNTLEKRNAHVMPEVVLLDLNMPRVDGLEVLRRIRSDERTRLLPVVILTSSREEKDIVNSYSLGANSYIVKPVDFDQFVQAVKQLGLYWLILNVTPRGDRSCL